MAYTKLFLRFCWISFLLFVCVWLKRKAFKAFNERPHPDVSAIGVSKTGLPKEFNNGTDSHISQELTGPTIKHSYAFVVVKDNTDHQILAVDSDGDIFLRSKWIGKDERLPASFRGLHCE